MGMKRKVERMLVETTVSKILSEEYGIEINDPLHSFTQDEREKIGAGDKIISKLAAIYGIKIHGDVPDLISSISEWADEIESEMSHNVS